MAQSSARSPARAWILAGSLLALLAVVAWFLLDDRAASATSPAPQEPRIPAATPSELQLAAGQGEAPQRASIESEATEPASAEPQPTAEVEPAAEVADLAARDWLTVRVVDERQVPIFDAAVSIRGLRKEGDEGSWYSRRDEATAVRTERDGRARLPYER